MATASTVARPFNALSGAEIKKAILNEIERNLDADYRFKQHLTYPLVSWCWELAAKVFPSDQSDIRIKIEKTIKAEGVDPSAYTSAPFSQVTFRHERTVAAPMAGETADAARRDTGQAVPTPRVVAGPEGTRMVVDAPEIPVGAKDDLNKPAEVTTSSTARAVNRARQSTSTPAAPARSISIRTRANPEGFEPPIQAGSKPDEGRMAEIEELEAKKPPEEAES